MFCTSALSEFWGRPVVCMSPTDVGLSSVVGEPRSQGPKVSDSLLGAAFCWERTVGKLEVGLSALVSLPLLARGSLSTVRVPPETRFPIHFLAIGFPAIWPAHAVF